MNEGGGKFSPVIRQDALRKCKREHCDSEHADEKYLGFCEHCYKRLGVCLRIMDLINGDKSLNVTIDSFEEVFTEIMLP